jgi:hypothetical protein
MSLALAPDLSATDTDDGMVLLDQRSGRYWMLNRTGATTLRLALAGRTPEEVAAELTATAPDGRARALADVQTLLASLRKARLVVPA